MGKLLSNVRLDTANEEPIHNPSLHLLQYPNQRQYSLDEALNQSCNTDISAFF